MKTKNLVLCTTILLLLFSGFVLAYSQNEFDALSDSALTKVLKPVLYDINVTSKDYIIVYKDFDINKTIRGEIKVVEKTKKREMSFKLTEIKACLDRNTRLYCSQAIAKRVAIANTVLLQQLKSKALKLKTVNTGLVVVSNTFKTDLQREIVKADANIGKTTSLTDAQSVST